MARKIRLSNKCIPGTEKTEAFLEDDGRIWVEDGLFGSKTIAYVKDNNVFLKEGVFGLQDRIAYLDDNGNVYSAQNEGWFTHGTKLGNVSSDGILRSASNSFVGRVDVSAKPSVNIPSSERGGSCLGDIAVAGVLVLLAYIGITTCWTTDMLSPSAHPQAILIWIAAAIACILGCRICYLNHISSVFAIVQASIPYYLILPVAISVILIIGVVIEGHASIGLIVGSLFATIVITLGIGAPLLIIQSIILALIAKLKYI